MKILANERLRAEYSPKMGGDMLKALYSELPGFAKPGRVDGFPTDVVGNVAARVKSGTATNERYLGMFASIIEEAYYEVDFIVTRNPNIYEVIVELVYRYKNTSRVQRDRILTYKYDISSAKLVAS